MPRPGVSPRIPAAADRAVAEAVASRRLAQPTAGADNGSMTDPAPQDEDPVLLVSRIAESLPTLDAKALERLAGALDELTEAVGLLMTADGAE